MPDSAGTATAIFSGVKSRYKVIGLDAKAPFNVCDADVNEARKLTTVADWAQSTGMDTGMRKNDNDIFMPSFYMLLSQLYDYCIR